MSILPLLSIANTDEIRNNIVKSVTDVIQQQSDDEYTKSEYSCSETEDEVKVGTFLTLDLTELVKLTLQPIMTDFMSRPTNVSFFSLEKRLGKVPYVPKWYFLQKIHS